jgi:hypothetical protein
MKLIQLVQVLNRARRELEQAGYTGITIPALETAEKEVSFGNISFPFVQADGKIVECTLDNIRESGWPIDEHTGEDLPLAL